MAGGRAERPAGDGADVVLELRDGAGVLRPVAGIVDARRELVDEQALALALARRRRTRCRSRRHSRARRGCCSAMRCASVGDRRRDARRHRRGVQDAVAVHVLGQVVARDRRRRARATAMIETSRANGDEAFEDGRRAADRGEAPRPASSPASDHGLALAVIAEAARLQDRRQAERAPAPSRATRRRRPRRRRAVAMPRSRRNVFSVSRSWLTASARAPGRTGTIARQPLDGRDVDVLELVGDDVDRAGEGVERGRVVVGGDRLRAPPRRRPGCPGRGR